MSVDCLRHSFDFFATFLNNILTTETPYLSLWDCKVHAKITFPYIIALFARNLPSNVMPISLKERLYGLVISLATKQGNCCHT